MTQLLFYFRLFSKESNPIIIYQPGLVKTKTICSDYELGEQEVSLGGEGDILLMSD